MSPYLSELENDALFEVDHPAAPAAAPLAIDDTTADLLFRDAHTTYRFSDEPVSDEQLRAVYELTKWAPTALNAQPLRVTLVRSAEARERLLRHLAAFNQAKSESAPAVAILSYDVDFHENLPHVAPHNPGARERFADEAARHGFGSFNGALQAAYFIVGVRAAGLAAGPMGGFDKAGLDAEFFPDGRQRSLLVVNIGYPAVDGQLPAQSAAGLRAGRLRRLTAAGVALPSGRDRPADSIVRRSESDAGIGRTEKPSSAGDQRFGGAA